MLELVDVGRRSLEAYRGIAPAPLLDDLVKRAEGLRGARVLHINATPYGGGVSEILRSTIPLLNDLGIVADWKIISGDDAFFRVTKAIHDGLQGGGPGLNAEDRAIYVTSSERNAALLEEEYDFVFIHDPQPAAILPLRGKGEARWIWRCHIDTSRPLPDVWEFLRAFLSEYDAGVFTLPDFVPPDFPVKRVETIPPAIDPLSPKNIFLGEQTARQVLEWVGIDLDRPLVTQVSRFDPWKDPLGVISAYRIAREEVPDLQLALVGSMALDDPEGWDVYHRIQKESAADPLIQIFTNLTGVGNIEVNAFQRLSNVIVQKSVREGFGLVVSEALWKETPVVAGRAGGIPLQMADGIGGCLVESVEECAAGILSLLKYPKRAQELAKLGKERIREHFLVPRLLLNEIDLMTELTEERPIVREGLEGDGRRDPVCGMAIGKETPAPSLDLGGQRYVFCSEACRAGFVQNSDRYLAVPREVQVDTP